MPPILSHERVEGRVLRHVEVVRPVAEHVVHVERRRGTRRARRLGRGVGKCQAVPALGVEIALAAARARVRGAPGALGGELPVGAVGACAGLEDLVRGARVGLGLDVGALLILSVVFCF